MIEKTTFTHGQNEDLSVGVLFTKVDKENRIVSGFATLDSRDDHGDVISADASRRAFARFRGGVREMHQPNAVGTLVKFEEARKYDPDSDRVYNGMYVHAKVSKGAQNTWEKVLDGTLKGFSIGGKMRGKSKDFDPDTGDEYTVITDYELHEISLVDNPANPLATVLTVQKIGDQLVYSDEVLEKQVMNILLQPESGDVILSEDAERDGFENIGWTDSVENTEKIRLALDAYKASTEDSGEEEIEKFAPALLEEDNEVILPEDNTDEGGATVATKKIEKQADEVVTSEDVKAEEVEEVDATAEVEDTEEDEDEDVVKAADVDEVPADESVDADEIVSKVTAAVEGALAKALDAAKESKDAATDVQSSFEKALEQFNETISDLKDSVQKDLNGLAKRVEDVESSTAVKKSADVTDDAEEDDEDDNFWRGSGFLSASDLVK